MRPVRGSEFALFSFAFSALGGDFPWHRDRYCPISGSAFCVSGFVASIRSRLLQAEAAFHVVGYGREEDLELCLRKAAIEHLP